MTMETMKVASSEPASVASRVAVFAFGLTAYALFLGTIVYTVGFVGNFLVPKSIDAGAAGPALKSVLINAVLMSLFVVQHTIMARPWFKVRWTKIVPASAERSFFVLATCAVLAAIFWQWQPLPDNVWHIDHAAGRAAVHLLFAAGWGLVLYASFCIDHFELFGLRQVYTSLRGKPYVAPHFVTPKLYKMVRNPLMLGFLIAMWSAPTMSEGRMLFAALITGYVFMGVAFEERDLLRALGEDYRQYRARTPMLIPRRPRMGPEAHIAPPPSLSDSRA